LCYEIEQRTKEIGIRIAIGAKHREVLALILAAGMKMSFGGVIIGILGSFAITRLIRGLLFNVSATDTFSFLFAGGVLLFVAALASCIVARRATQVDPVVALRHE
jgi:putative ABC transport system permease protein